MFSYFEVQIFGGIKYYHSTAPITNYAAHQRRLTVNNLDFSFNPKYHTFLGAHAMKMAGAESLCELQSISFVDFIGSFQHC